MLFEFYILHQYIWAPHFYCLFPCYCIALGDSRAPVSAVGALSSLTCGRKCCQSFTLCWSHFPPFYSHAGQSRYIFIFGPISEILFSFWTHPLAFTQCRAMWRHLTCAWQSRENKISNRMVKKLICIRHYECLIPNLLFLQLTLLILAAYFVSTLILAACVISTKYRKETFWAWGISENENSVSCKKKRLFVKA